MNKNGLEPDDIEKVLRTLMAAKKPLDAMDLKYALEGDRDARTNCYNWFDISYVLSVLKNRGIVKPAGKSVRGLQNWTCRIKTE